MFTHREQSSHVLAADAYAENVEIEMEIEEQIDMSAHLLLDLEREMTEKEMTESTGNFYRLKR